MLPEARRSPLHQTHLEAGAKLVPFGGWDMPLNYERGTIAEHLACRNDAVVFDVSHLGTLRVTGPGALGALQASFTNDLGRIEPGRAQYTHLLDPDDGSVLDDIIVWWVDEERFDVMPNASNTDRVATALREADDPPAMEDVTATRAVLAVQGPNARTKLEAVAPDAAAVGRFRVAPVVIGGADTLVAGTGYTGEDGLEIAVPVEQAATVWASIVGAGITPAGLGARDTLRLEAGLPLPAYEQVLKASHTFNLLDARHAISVTERQRFILRVRALARDVAQAYYDSRETLGFPMLAGAEGTHG